MARRRIGSFPVASGKVVELAYATAEKRQALGRAVRRWGDALRSGANPVKLDAVELANLAFRRWCEGLSKRRIAGTLQDIKDHIQDNPHAEVSVLLLARASWLRHRSLVGLCHFRRTWANNLFIDFLAAHPSIAGERESPLGGLGTGMLHHIMVVAEEIHAGAIWGEATQNSVWFYRKIFERPEMGDLIYLAPPEYAAFRKKVEEKWRSGVKSA